MSELMNSGLPAESIPLLQPQAIGPNGRPTASYLPHCQRAERLAAVDGYDELQRTVAERRMGRAALLPYLTPTGIRDTFAGTQYPGENHRRLAPFLQELLAYDDTREGLLAGIDEASARSTEQLLAEASENGGTLTRDVGILGSGPHGTAAAMHLRERFPHLSVVMVDDNMLGGQWRRYGPRPAFVMNSRVRRPNRLLPPFPRTPGNINPLGTWAVLELADVVTGNYATNTEMGDVTAVNAYLAADDTLLGHTCAELTDAGISADMTLLGPDGPVKFKADAIVDASGIRQESALAPPDTASPWYFDSAAVYEHFGNRARSTSHCPLEVFNDKDVLLIGGGDGALTVLQALLGTLPRETYGPYGVGRYGPRSITWVGAPGGRYSAIDECLRSHYKDGVMQALPKYPGDQGAIISPVLGRALYFEREGDDVQLTLENGDVLKGDILIDCTNGPRQDPYGPPLVQQRPSRIRPAVYRVGPGANESVPSFARPIIDELGIPENTVSLWALMARTDDRATATGQRATTNKRRRLVASDGPGQ
jgi:hypothetical protein